MKVFMTIRRKLLYVLSSISPSVFYPSIIKALYFNRTGEKCDLDKPKKYSEKIQWRKLQFNTLDVSKYVDKWLVRDWVREKIGDEYLIPAITGVFSDVREIDFDALPKKFVIKATHGSGYTLVVNDKAEIDKEYAVRTINNWLKHNYAFYTMELQYKSILPRVYVEENLLDDNEKDLTDYKFFCFNGKVFCSYTMIDYTSNHSNGKLGFFSRDYKLLPYYREDFKPITDQLEKPEEYEKMVEIAEKLSEGFSHVRVDLYNVHGKIYFGEMTFTSASGYCRYVPEEFEYILGKEWDVTSGI